MDVYKHSGLCDASVGEAILLCGSVHIVENAKEGAAFG